MLIQEILAAGQSIDDLLHSIPSPQLITEIKSDNYASFAYATKEKRWDAIIKFLEILTKEPELKQEISEKIIEAFVQAVSAGNCYAVKAMLQTMQDDYPIKRAMILAKNHSLLNEAITNHYLDIAHIILEAADRDSQKMLILARDNNGPYAPFYNAAAADYLELVNLFLAIMADDFEMKEEMLVRLPEAKAAKSISANVKKIIDLKSLSKLAEPENKAAYANDINCFMLEAMRQTYVRIVNLLFDDQKFPNLNPQLSDSEKAQIKSRYLSSDHKEKIEQIVRTAGICASSFFKKKNHIAQTTPNYLYSFAAFGKELERQTRVQLINLLIADNELNSALSADDKAKAKLNDLSIDEIVLIESCARRVGKWISDNKEGIISMRYLVSATTPNCDFHKNLAELPNDMKVQIAAFLTKKFPYPTAEEFPQIASSLLQELAPALKQLLRSNELTPHHTFKRYYDLKKQSKEMMADERGNIALGNFASPGYLLDSGFRMDYGSHL